MRIKPRRKHTRGYTSTYTKKRFALGPLSLGFITVLLFSLVSILYLAQNNQITTKGYILKELETERTKILSENERLQVEAARLESLSKISQEAEKLSMVPLRDLRYFGTTTSVLARR